MSARTRAEVELLIKRAEKQRLRAAEVIANLKRLLSDVAKFEKRADENGKQPAKRKPPK